MASPSRSRSVARKTWSEPRAAFSISATCLRRSSEIDVLRREVVVDVHAELALAGVLRQVADVAVRREDAVVVAEVAFDRPRLGRRLDDHEVLWHGRECSTGHLRSRLRLPQTSRIRCRKSSSISSSASLRPSRRLRRPVPTSNGEARGWDRPGPGGPSPSGRQPPSPTRPWRSKAPSRDLDEADVEVREEEGGLAPVDEVGRLPSGVRRLVHTRPASDAEGRAEQVRHQRLLVVDVDDDVADHGPIVLDPGPPSPPRWSHPGAAGRRIVRGGRSR